MEFQQVFVIIWLIIMFAIASMLYATGKDALSIFPDIDSVNVLFREKRVSGNSNKSFFTKMGGAQNVLDVVITHNELWIKSAVLFAGLGKKSDLLHRVRLEDVISVKEVKNKVHVEFKNKGFSQSHVVLQMRDGRSFIDILTSCVKTNSDNSL